MTGQSIVLIEATLSAGDVEIGGQREEIRSRLLSFIVDNETRRQQERGQR